MKRKNNNLTIIYVLIAILLVFTILNFFNVFQPEMKWRCNYAECEEYKEISGEEWAQENCFITNDGVLCVATLEDGQQIQVPLEELNLAEISATKCLKYVCTDEVPYREPRTAYDPLEQEN